MKFAAISASIALVILFSCSHKSNDQFSFNIIPKQGKGPVKEKEIVADFDEIRVAQSIEAEVIKSDKERIILSAPSDIIDDVVVETVGGKLYIHFKPGINISANRVKAKIYARDFSKLEASSSATINLKDQFTQEKTDIQVTSSATIQGNIEANELDIDVSSSGTFSGKVWAVDLDVDVSSSGDVNISGKTKNADLDASSSGTVSAKDVLSENADLKASSSGSISISVSKNLKATANSSGDINVVKTGNLQSQVVNENSGGSISIR